MDEPKDTTQPTGSSQMAEPAPMPAAPSIPQAPSNESVIPPVDQTFTPAVMPRDGASMGKSGKNQSKTTILVIAVIIVLLGVIVAVVGVKLKQSNNTASMMQPNSAVYQSPIMSATPMASQAGTTNTDSSDQGLNTDVSNIQKSLNAANTDVSNADSGLNDKQTDLTY